MCVCVCKCGLVAGAKATRSGSTMRPHKGSSEHTGQIAIDSLCATKEGDTCSLLRNVIAHSPTGSMTVCLILINRIKCVLMCLYDTSEPSKLL